MATNYVQKGESLQWVNGTGSAVVSGQVVAVGQRIGIAADNIASTATGTVYMEGVFNVPKVSAAVIAQGEMVAWDASEGKFDDNALSLAAGDITNAAIAWEKGIATQTTIDVKLTNQVATVDAG